MCVALAFAAEMIPSRYGLPDNTTITAAHLTFCLGLGLAYGCLAGKLRAGLTAAVLIPLVIVFAITLVFLVCAVANEL